MKVQVLIIDPQNDFCDPGGALYVPGADGDMGRLAKLVRENLGRLDDIQVTLDSHQLVHVAHPLFWVDGEGRHPDPFTLLREADVAGPGARWRAYNPGLQRRAVDYVRALGEGGRYDLCIWPVHCEIGSWGHNVYPELMEALRLWQGRFALVDFVTKGSNPLTEHYSVVRADVVDPEDPSTHLNTAFIGRLEAADEILVAGEALSHCVANSVRDIAAEFGPEQVKKLVLLEDACSPVPGFEDLAVDFVGEMVGRGMRVSTTADYWK